MSIKRRTKLEQGFISLEMIMSLIFLVVMVLFSYKMFDQQEKIILKANIDVEITNTMYQLRNALSGIGCTENFSGLLENSGNEIIKNIKLISSATDSRIREIFPIHTVLDHSRHQLKIDSYHLIQNGIAHRSGAGKTYLVVSFEAGHELPIVRKEIKIYTELSERKIVRCSLAPLNNEPHFWSSRGERLISKESSFGIKSFRHVGTINLAGGLYVEKSLVVCNSSQEGSFYWNSKKRKWILCRDAEEVTLEDQRNLFIKRQQ